MMTLLRRNAPGARLLALTFFALGFAFAPTIFSRSNLVWSQEPGEGARKILSRITPQYPNLANNMKIKGVVKVEAVVAPNGTAKVVEVKGGHPLLAQSASNAVRLWKWEPAVRETHELIEIKFNPE
jgi:TonB family protein